MYSCSTCGFTGEKPYFNLAYINKHFNYRRLHHCNNCLLNVQKRCAACGKNKTLSEYKSHYATEDKKGIFCRQCYGEMQEIKKQYPRQYHWACRSLRQHSRYGFVVNVSIFDLVQKAIVSNVCPYCGCNICWDKRGLKLFHDTPTVDRTENSLIMTINSIMIICYRCNSAKGKSSPEEYKKWIQDASNWLSNVND